MAETRDPLIDHLEEKYGYTDIAEIGRGGMGVVYSATDEPLKRKVAIKRLGANVEIDDDALRRFETEMTTLANLRDEAIVGVHTAGNIDGRCPYYVMDFIEGVSLKQELDQRRRDPGGRPFTVAEATRILRPVARALDYLHGQTPQVIHRDVKPANILRPSTKQHRVAAVLVDFGIIWTPDTTRTGAFIGTPAYAPPEAFTGGGGSSAPLAPTAAGDDYALALVAFEMLTLQKFHDLVGPGHWQGDRPRVRLGSGSIHPDDAAHHAAITDVFARALANRPADRYSTAAGFIDQLAAAAAGRDVAGRAEALAETIVDARPLDAPGVTGPWATTGSFPSVTGSFPSPTGAYPAAGAPPARPGGGRGRLVAVLTALTLLLVGVLGFGGYRMTRAWPEEQRAIVSDFDRALPAERGGRVGWAIGDAGGYSCSAVRWRSRPAVRCAAGEDGTDVIFVDFGGGADRDRAFGEILGGEDDWRDYLVRATSERCSVEVFRSGTGDADAAFVFPEGDKERYSVVLTGPEAHEGWEGLPLC